MKKLSIALLSVMAIGFATSCSDDDSKGETSGTLEGKWNYSKTITSFAGQSMTDEYEHTAGCSKDYIEFVAGGVYNDVYHYGSECSTSTFEDTWVRSNNTLTIGESEGAEVYTIDGLNGSELKLKMTETLQGQTYTITDFYTKN